MPVASGDPAMPHRGGRGPASQAELQKSGPLLRQKWPRAPGAGTTRASPGRRHCGVSTRNLGASRPHATCQGTFLDGTPGRVACTHTVPCARHRHCSGSLREPRGLVNSPPPGTKPMWLSPPLALGRSKPWVTVPRISKGTVALPAAHSDKCVSALWSPTKPSIWWHGVLTGPGDGRLSDGSRVGVAPGAGSRSPHTCPRHTRGPQAHLGCVSSCPRVAWTNSPGTSRVLSSLSAAGRPQGQAVLGDAFQERRCLSWGWFSRVQKTQVVSPRRGPGPLSVTERGRTSLRAGDHAPVPLPPLASLACVNVPSGRVHLVVGGRLWDTLQKRERRPRARSLQKPGTNSGLSRMPGPFGLRPSRACGMYLALSLLHEDLLPVQGGNALKAAKERH